MMRIAITSSVQQIYYGDDIKEDEIVGTCSTHGSDG
jgi:hypothetical protein